jgi:hypothetical protein
MMPFFSLVKLLSRRRKRGEAVYKLKADEIAAKRQAIEPQLQLLNEELKSGSITPDE